MSINYNEDTEFNDALRKHGIIPALPEKERTPSPPPSPTLSELSLSDLSDFANENENRLDDDTERVIDQLKRRKAQEQAEQAKKGWKFGRVYPIGREQYTKEVTDASIDNPETGVICFLYKDGISRSDLTKPHIEALAPLYPQTKFVSIVGDKCIPNLPDSRIPMIIVYKSGEIVEQLTAWKGGQLHELEAVLLVTKALHKRAIPRKTQRDEDGDSGDESDPTMTNGRTEKNIRRKAEKNDEDDFEFDL